MYVCTRARRTGGNGGGGGGGGGTERGGGGRESARAERARSRGVTGRGCTSISFPVEGRAQCDEAGLRERVARGCASGVVRSSAVLLTGARGVDCFDRSGTTDCSVLGLCALLSPIVLSGDATEATGVGVLQHQCGRGRGASSAT